VLCSRVEMQNRGDMVGLIQNSIAPMLHNIVKSKLASVALIAASTASRLRFALNSTRSGRLAPTRRQPRRLTW
jgi:hypothetical protein